MKPQSLCKLKSYKKGEYRCYLGGTLKGISKKLSKLSVTHDAPLHKVGGTAQTTASIIQALVAEDLVTKTTAVRMVHDMSKKWEPESTSLINAEVIKKVVKALYRDDCPELQFEAVRTIGALVSYPPTYKWTILEANPISALVTLWNRGGDIGKQAAYVLWN